MNTKRENPTSCELRSVIRFLNARNVRPAEIHRQITEVYGQNIMNEGNVRKWCRLFNEGRTNVHDENRSGRSSLVTDDLLEQVNAKILENRRVTVSELHKSFPCISRSLVYEIVTEHLHYRNLGEKSVNDANRKGKQTLWKRKDAEDFEIPVKTKKIAVSNISEDEASDKSVGNKCLQSTKEVDASCKNSGDEACNEYQQPMEGVGDEACNEYQQPMEGIFDEVIMKIEPMDEIIKSEPIDEMIKEEPVNEITNEPTDEMFSYTEYIIPNVSVKQED